MAFADLIPCDFNLMEVPTLAEFEAAYAAQVRPFRNRDFCAQLWNTLPDEERKRAIFYIRYFARLDSSRNCPPMRAETYLVCCQWKDLAQVITQQMEAPWKPVSPPLAPELSEVVAR